MRTWEPLEAFDFLQVTAEVALSQVSQQTQSLLAQLKIQVYHQGPPPNESRKVKDKYMQIDKKNKLQMRRKKMRLKDG